MTMANQGEGGIGSEIQFSKRKETGWPDQKRKVFRHPPEWLLEEATE
jgi:hypothetical protein